jgi:hypothetical protein
MIVFKLVWCMSLVGWLSLLGVVAVAGTVGVAMSLVLTTPNAIGPAGVTAWFVMLYITLSALLALAFYGVKAYLRVHATSLARLRYSWRQGMLLSGWITGLLALSSLKQLGWLDGILLGLILGIVEVYVRFRWP